jgi:phosphoglucosamine mutase
MERQYFGTDGIRGRVGDHPITPEFMVRLGYAAGRTLAPEGGLVVLGKDTRISGYMLESALEAGFSAAGVGVRLTGPMPTPAIAYLTRSLRARAGVVISASHNPYDDNGIKFFSAQGDKLSDEEEFAIEAALEAPLRTRPSAALGRAARVNDAEGRYLEFCKNTTPDGFHLRGLKLVVDCAHGATYHLAPALFEELGATVEALGVSPDGLNINDGCGATAPEALRERVLETGADLGLAFDGDGDRLIMVDSRGTVRDGDSLLYVLAMHQQREGTFAGGVVGTLMSNLGLEQALQASSIPFARAGVGDRYVLAECQVRGWRLGGEGSGHILCLDAHSTGDGMIAALQVLVALRAAEQTLEDALAPMTLCPQVLINVAAESAVLKAAAVTEAVAGLEEALGDRGRILLRASGTQPLVRVMVEGLDGDQVHQVASRLAATVRSAAAGGA